MTTYEMLRRDYLALEQEKARFAAALESIACHGLDARQCMELAKRTIAGEAPPLPLLPSNPDVDDVDESLRAGDAHRSSMETAGY